MVQKPEGKNIKFLEKSNKLEVLKLEGLVIA
jgi:hypothetical protein